MKPAVEALRPVNTVAQVAAFLQVRQETVCDLIARRELIAVKFGNRWRIRREDVEALLAEQR